MISALLGGSLLLAPSATAAGTLRDRDNGFKLTVTSKKRVTLRVPGKFTGSDALLQVGCTSGKQFAPSGLIDFQFIDSDRTLSGNGTFYPDKMRFCRIERSAIVGPSPVRVVAKFKMR